MGIRRQRAAEDADSEIFDRPVVTKERDMDEDERPTRRRRERDEDEQPRRSRRDEPQDDQFEDEDEDEQSPRSSRIASGWKAAKKLREESSDYATDFKLTEDPQLIKFIGDEPFAVFKQHFLREKDGKKSYVCLGKGCPLCDELGHHPDQKFAFNVVDLSEDEPTMKMLLAGPKLLRVIEDKHNGRRGPIDKGYWEIKRSGKGNQTNYTLEDIRESDLAEDYDLDPDKVEQAINALKPYDASYIRETTKGELRQIADDLS